MDDLELEQLDVKTAFLYGKLDEEIYMDVPEGVPVPSKISRPVCKLKKTIYRLKQSPRAWYARIDAFLQSLSYISTHADTNVYVKREGKKFIALAIYVDDIIVMSNSWTMIRTVKQQLGSEFKMTDGGPLHFCLGMHLVRDRKAGTIFLHQAKYTREILARYGMENCKSVATPAKQNVKYSAQLGDIPEEEIPAVEDYASRNGSVMHLMIGSRPDISFSSGLTSRFVSNPNAKHSDLMTRQYRYLAGTADWGLLYSAKADKPLTLVAYSDADWAGDPDDLRSVSSYVTLLAGAAVGWSSKKQTTIALSSTKAEFKSLTEASKEIAWTIGALRELGYEQHLPIRLYCDNQSAIALTMNRAHYRGITPEQSI